MWGELHGVGSVPKGNFGRHFHGKPTITSTESAIVNRIG